jgi:3-phosphoshikimate 1-carboxyvinyltransferase
VAFRISPPGKLSGSVRLPGDLGLTLSSLAFGMISGRSVTIANPSPAPDVENLRRFLREQGAQFTVTPEGFILHGGQFAGDLSISETVPGEVLHILAASAAFSPCTVRIVNRAHRRDRIIRRLLPLFRSLGLPERSFASGEESVSITGNGAPLPERISVASAWEMEAVLAAAIAAGKPITIAHPGQTASHVLRIMEALGARNTEAPGRDYNPDELARRLAKISRERPLEESRFRGTCVDAEIRIPGDTTLAAAVAGAAAVIARSDVTLREVLWEPGRKGFFEALRRMRGTVEWTPKRGYSFEAAEVRVKGSGLEGIQITPALAQTMHSELPVLGAVAVSARGETVLRDPDAGPGLGREAFRILKAGLETLGAHIGDYREGLVVKGPRELKGARVQSDGVPGIALALALAGMIAAGETEIVDYEPDAYPLREFGGEYVPALTARPAP